MRRLSTISLALPLALTLGATACSSASEQDATRDDSGTITESDEVGVFRLQEGDCLLLPGSGVAGEEVMTMEAVPCAEPHSGEVLALVDVEGGDDAPFPGDEAIDEAALTHCLAAFESTTGNDFATDPDWNMTSLNPTAQSWDQAGDREVVCIVTPLNSDMTTDVVTG